MKTKLNPASRAPRPYFTNNACISRFSYLHAIVCMGFFSATIMPAEAQWWNLIGPKTYEDCVLEKIKNTQGEDAVRALQHACIVKFDVPRSKVEKAAERDKEKLRLKCGNPSDYYAQHTFFDIQNDPQKITHGILNKISQGNYFHREREFQFQNGNSFGISGLQVGLTKEKSCPLNISAFTYVTYCRSYSTDSGVSGNSYGELNCGKVPEQASRLRSCLVGFSPMYKQFSDEILVFKNDKGYCQ